MSTSQQICQWLDEELDDGILHESDDESCSEDLINENHESASEQSNDENESENSVISYYTGKDNITRWRQEPQARNVRTRAHNIVLHLPGPKKVAKNATTHLDCFHFFIDEAIINIIVNSTNIYIEKAKGKYERDRDAKLTNQTEIRALFGILYLAGILKAGRLNVKELWDRTGTGIEAIYVTMSYNRFQFLLRCLRFDDIRDRAQRKEIDKLASIREVFEIFIQNSQRAYTPSEYVTIDEQLVAFRGRCPIKVYIPSKPAKYGIKIFAMVDVKTQYTHNLEIYAGQQPDGPFQQSNSGHSVVKRLVDPIRGTGRNITVDNWFTSVPLAIDLVKNDNLTLVGTLRKNKKEIPPQFTSTQRREINSTLFGFTEDCTLASYMPKKNKTVLVVSTMHHDKAIDSETEEKQKPEIVTFYNRTKCAVDLLDQMCSAYDVARNSRRWPLTIFFDLLNIAGLNSLILYAANHDNNKPVRRSFLRSLALDLMKPFISERITKQSVPPEIKRRGKILLGVPDILPEEHTRPQVIGRCYLCGRARNKSTRKSCSRCMKWICPGHANTEVLCLNCANERIAQDDDRD